MKKFCVIHPTQSGNGGNGIYRKLYETEAEAIEHAKELLAKRSNYMIERGRPLDAAKLFVVEIKSVVETAAPPTTVRKLRATDVLED